VSVLRSASVPRTEIPFCAEPGTLCCTTFSSATTWPPSELWIPPFRLSWMHVRATVAYASKVDLDALVRRLPHARIDRARCRPPVGVRLARAVVRR
jgi:hypothetical protein